MMPRLSLVFFVSIMLFSSAAAASQDDLLEKINRLEQQIQELKALKEQQIFFAAKEEACLKAVGRDKFCKCVAQQLPREAGFELYVHTLITPKEKLGYAAMTPEQKASVDAILEVRDKCVEKGFFK